MRDAVRMTKVIFGGKQFFLGTLALTRDWLLPYRLTPARFDMLTAIARDRGGLAQRELRRILGVSSPTISRMLKGLEKLRFVIRRPHPRNARHRWISLTSAGAFVLGAVLSNIVEGGDFPWVTREFLNGDRDHRDTLDLEVREADAFFERSCEALGHTATLAYPYEDHFYSVAFEPRTPRFFTDLAAATIDPADLIDLTDFTDFVLTPDASSPASAS